jgi:hypothetical protein
MGKPLPPSFPSPELLEPVGAKSLEWCLRGKGWGREIDPLPAL